MESKNQNTLPDIRKMQLLNAPIQKVWDAVATSEGISAWFMPNDFQPVVGHEFHLEAGAFGKSPCTVTEIDPPHRLSFKWGKDWTLTFELMEKGNQTEFTLIHSGWDADKATEFGQTHAMIRERMDNGWVGLLKTLSEYVEA
ncbi:MULTISPECIES: SRPBCC domain-containing protein [unclassified Paenibacillus]|uniref:SRPBCC family protein n=1 Tax=unclassified Paenibacillus TaxID=185978 RepID=UPI001AEB240E|nr:MULTISPECIES: SRPBCC domain-containing protein [unclassified Paenibacillus]MBP1153314.1 uncharacterized protein YndB with AHSA1/START domain [Paenibacillus sp. PvP091]MBP1171303.1 uncharacterized protein YndB with AHSA1/START domain [Paenibacillus sp. PvR098]MBP2442331.1 uncharacterized protein YndB with AHSA1/START domain [Paenibacillus sp. PvP052]